MSKDEATRLADALADGNIPWNVNDAVALLRRWPDAGEPVAWADERAISWLANSRSSNASVTTKLAKQRSPRCTMPLHAAPPAKPDGEPVAEVEADGVLRFKKTGWKWKVGDTLYTAPPAEAERIAALEGEAPALPKADVSVPFYKETVTLAQGDYYRADKVLPLLKNWAVLYAAAKAGHEQAFAQSQEKSERIAALEAQVEALRVDAERWRHWRKHHHTQEPVAQRVPNSRGRHDYWDYGETYSADMTPENLYTVYTPPADAERIAALEAVIEQARVALEEMQYARTEKAERLTAEALRAIEEVQHARL